MTPESHWIFGKMMGNENMTQCAGPGMYSESMWNPGPHQMNATFFDIGSVDQEVWNDPCLLQVGVVFGKPCCNNPTSIKVVPGLVIVIMIIIVVIVIHHHHHHRCFSNQMLHGVEHQQNPIWLRLPETLIKMYWKDWLNELILLSIHQNSLLTLISGNEPTLSAKVEKGSKYLNQQMTGGWLLDTQQTYQYTTYSMYM